jgi:phosphoesterase RecJ-like protein
VSRLASPDALLEILRGARQVLITSHVNPDGDAVGSSLALARMLRQMGKRSLIWHCDPPPTVCRVLAGCGEIHVGTEPPAGFPEGFDLAVLLECPTLERSGIEESLSVLPMVNIDHHLGNAEYGVVNWVDPGAAAVGEMLTHLAMRLGLELDGDSANALLLALVTDTGGFRFANADPHTFETAAALVRAGARPALVSQWLYESLPLASVRLLAEVLGTLQLHYEGRIATVLLTREMMAKAGAGPGDTEGLIDHPRSIAGVDAVAMFREVDAELTKVSLRSRGNIDVEKVAHRQGGGGHRNAAGFKSRQPYPNLLHATVAALHAALLEAEVA